MGVHFMSRFNGSEKSSSVGSPIIRSEELDEVKHRVLYIGDVSSDEDLLAFFLRQQDIKLSFNGPEAESDNKQGGAPDLVLLNLDELESNCHSKIDHAKSYGVAVICTIPLEQAKNPNLISQLSFDDYIFRPYRPEKLLLRMQVLLERSKKLTGTPMIEKRRLSRRKDDSHISEQHYVTGGSLLSIDDREKSIRIGERHVLLTPKEYSLFSLLASEVGRVFTPKEIIRHVWPTSCERTCSLDVQQYMHLLRKKVEVDPKHPEIIVTMKGFGYKLIIPRAK